MSFYHPEASGATTLTQTGGFCPLTNDLPEITNCSEIPTSILPNPPSGPIATYEGINGSSTDDLNQLGLTYEIHRVLDASGTDITSTQTVFTIADATVLGKIVGQLSHDETQARGNSYNIEVRVYDYEGVEPNSSGSCTTTIAFPDISSIDYNGNQTSVSRSSNQTNNQPPEGTLEEIGFVTVTGNDAHFGIRLDMVGVGNNSNQNATATLTISVGAVSNPATDETITLTFPGALPVPPTQTTSITPVIGPTNPGITRSEGSYYYRITIINNSDGDIFNNVTATTTILDEQAQ